MGDPEAFSAGDSERAQGALRIPLGRGDVSCHPGRGQGSEVPFPLNAGEQKAYRAWDRSLENESSMFWLQNVKHILKSDTNANGLYRKCKKITKAQLQPGDFVFKLTGSKATHIEYVVDKNLNVIEARGRDYGVVKRALSKGPWNCFCCHFPCKEVCRSGISGDSGIIGTCGSNSCRRRSCNCSCCYRLCSFCRNQKYRAETESRQFNTKCKYLIVNLSDSVTADIQELHLDEKVSQLFDGVKKTANDLSNIVVVFAQDLGNDIVLLYNNAKEEVAALASGLQTRLVNAAEGTKAYVVDASNNVKVFPVEKGTAIMKSASDTIGDTAQLICDKSVDVWNFFIDICGSVGTFIEETPGTIKKAYTTVVDFIAD